MTSIRGFMLAGAAMLATAGVARAADLPMAEPVEYVKVCSAAGAGFFYLPGSNTCLQISGYARADYMYTQNPAGLTKSDRQKYSNTQFLARGRVNFDAITDTEYGPLRSYIRFQFDRLTAAGDKSPSGGGAFIDRAFIEFAGLTAGYVTSFYDFYADADIFGSVAGSDQTIPLLAYTFKMDKLSATISAEDQSYRKVFGVGGWTGSVKKPIDFPSGVGYGGQSVPDIVGQLKWEGDWVTAQLSGAGRRMSTNVGNVDDEFGYAVQGGLAFKTPTGTDDVLYLQGAYGQGAVSYLSQLSYDSFFDPSAPDAVVTGKKLSLAEDAAFTGEFYHHWTDQWRSAVAGSWATVNYDKAAKDRGAQDLDSIVVSGNLIWTPVKNLDIGAEVGWTKIDFTSKGSQKDYDKFAGIFRIERDF